MSYQADGPQPPITEVVLSSPATQDVLFATPNRAADAKPTGVHPSPPEKLKGSIFLCHSSGDKEQVRKLYRRLKGDRIRCWFDEEDLLPGQDFDYEIGRAIRASRYVLVCLSNSSITKRGYVQKEIVRALDVAEEQPEGVAYIIPVRLEECEVPERLQRWHWVDLFKDGGYERLVRGLGFTLPAVATYRPTTPDVYKYIRDIHNRISQLANAAVGDQLETIRTEDKVDGTDFVTVMAPTQRINAEFALKVTWAQDQDELYTQVDTAKQWMRSHGLPGIIAVREYLGEKITTELKFNGNERHIQLLLWRDEQDDEALKLCLRRITGAAHYYGDTS